MILCDTDVMIHFLRGKEETFIELRKIGFVNIQISAVTLIELYQGAKNKEDLISIKKQIKYFDLLPIVKKVSDKTVELVDKFGLSHGLRIADGLIAATAIVQDIEIFTYNLKDFTFLTGFKIYKKN